MQNKIKNQQWINLGNKNEDIDITESKPDMFHCKPCGQTNKGIKIEHMSMHCASLQHKKPEEYIRKYMDKYDIQGTITKLPNSYAYEIKCSKCVDPIYIKTLKKIGSCLSTHKQIVHEKKSKKRPHKEEEQESGESLEVPSNEIITTTNYMKLVKQKLLKDGTITALAIFQNDLANYSSKKRIKN